MSCKIDASTRYRPIVDAMYRIALEDAHEKIGYSPADGDTTKDHAYQSKFLHWKDSIEECEKRHLIKAVCECVKRQRQPEVLFQMLDRYNILVQTPIMKNFQLP